MLCTNYQVKARITLTESMNLYYIKPVQYFLPTVTLKAAQKRALAKWE